MVSVSLRLTVSCSLLFGADDPNNDDESDNCFSVSRQSNNRKSESQVIWRSDILKRDNNFDHGEHYESPIFNGQLTENPSIDTMKRSVSHANLNNSRRSYHKRFLSKPSLSISRINTSAYYNQQCNMTKSKIYSENAKHGQRSNRQK
jgi:hypothetical protein